MRISKIKPLAVILSVLVVAVTATVVFSLLWYKTQLSPYDVNNTTKTRIIIKDQASAGQIIDQLEEKQIIRSAFAARIYLKLNNLGADFKAGVYSVAPSQSLAEVLDHLINGKADERSIMFYPGAMIVNKSSDKEAVRKSVRGVLLDEGFSEDEVDQALKAKYDSPVFAGRPDDAGLEGYIYGETYYVVADATAEQILQRAIDEFTKVVKENDFKRKFADQGLTLYQGITLASIVQRESLGCQGQPACDDQRQIASVFYNRLKTEMPLGSDVTYHYAADKDGLERNFQLDSPYNTRIHTGLPPGPIAVPGLSALNAVADPVTTDYLYFLSGDDHVTYFAKTNEEHEVNIRDRCKVKCLLP